MEASWRLVLKSADLAPVLGCISLSSCLRCFDVKNIAGGDGAAAKLKRFSLHCFYHVFL
jgi:hypothetical protein